VEGGGKAAAAAVEASDPFANDAINPTLTLTLTVAARRRAGLTMC
jgi:hypothetical protein